LIGQAPPPKGSLIIFWLVTPKDWLSLGAIFVVDRNATESVSLCERMKG